MQVPPRIPDFRKISPSDVPPLWIAACEGNLQSVKRFIHQGHDVNENNKTMGVTALHIASSRGHSQVTEELIANGADLKAGTTWCGTILHTAVLSGKIQIVKQVIVNGPDVNATDINNLTALHIACESGYLHIAEELLAKGADLNIRNSEGKTAAELAAQNGRTDTVKFLVNRIQDRGNKYSVKRDSWDNEVVHNLLMAATKGGRMATVQELITTSGADPNQRSLGTCFTAEEMAHVRGHSDIAWFLNKFTDGRNRPSGSRPEMDACKLFYGFESSIEMQIGNDISTIHPCALDAGMYELHYQDEEGMTLLHTKVKRNQLSFIPLLLERGALATALNHDGVTPYDLARKEGFQEAANMIKEHLKKFNKNELKSASEKSHYYTVLLCLILDCISIACRYKDDDGKAESERQQVTKNVSGLLYLGVPLEPPGNYCTHALHLAAITNCKHILTLLLAAGAPLHTTHSGLGIVEVAWLTPDVTTWVSVTVTRAVMNKLKSEVKGLRFSTVTDWLLIFFTIDLIDQLDGQMPWQAKFSCQEYLNVLLNTACEQGATLIAWWVWRAGDCSLFQRKTDGKTTLHITLDGKQYQTARALVQYMDANAFLPDNKGRLPIDLFPKQDRIDVTKDSLVKEYRVLDGVLQRAIDSFQKREAKGMILLFLTLVMMWKINQYKPSDDDKKPSDDDKWKKFYKILISFLYTFDEVHDTHNWIVTFNEKLNKINSGVPCKDKKNQVRDHNKSSFLRKLDSKYYSDDESDGLDILIELLEPVVRNFITCGKSLPCLSGKASEGISDRYINTILTKGLKMCSGMKLPMFLHLLVSNAKVNPKIVTDHIIKTGALHKAAMDGNMSAACYLLSNGASLTKQDKWGRTPSHFAYMHGYKYLGAFLNTHPEIASKNGLKPTDLWQAYQKYLHLYELDLDEIKKHEFTESNNSDYLIQLHLEALKTRLSKRGIKEPVRGIKEAVREAKVDYTRGESFAVQDTLKQLLEKLISDVGKLDSRFDAELVFVGSSADDVRLITPDEYDCNVVLKNFSGYPDGGCKIHLHKSSADIARHTYKDMDITVTTEREDLKDLFKERNLLITFSRLIKKCLPKLSMDDPRISSSLPSVKLTQVGVGLRFVWNGKEFPLLLIDVDVVPTMKAPWPTSLEKAILLPDTKEVFLNTVGRNEWRLSTAQAEKQVMECLSHDEKFVFLACKLAIASLKTEGWVPQQVKDQFKYWDGQKFKIPLPKGFVLKNSFFFEKEEVTDPMQWKEEKLMERMCSIFKRMCYEMEKDKKPIFLPGKVPSYFGRSTEKDGVGFGASEILACLQDWQRSASLHDRSVRPKTFSARKIK